MKFLIVTLILIVTAFSLKVFKLLLKKVSENSSFGIKAYKIEPLFALIIWSAVTFWGVYFLFYQKTYYNFIVFALIVIIFISISWFFLKDFMAGVAFKIQNNYLPGDLIQFGEISGKLESLSLTYASVYTYEGKLVKIPYSRLSNEIVSQKSAGNIEGSNHFTIKLPKESSVDEYKIVLENLIMNSPWRLPRRKPLIKLITESNDFFEFDVQVETRSEKHLNYVIAYLKRRFNIKGTGKSCALT